MKYCKNLKHMQIYAFMINEATRLHGNVPTNADIAQHFHVTPQNVSGHLRLLEQKGLVEKVGGHWCILAMTVTPPIIEWEEC